MFKLPWQWLLAAYTKMHCHRAENPHMKSFMTGLTAQEALDSTAATWEEITDRLDRDEQLRLYHDAIGYEG